MIYIFSYWIFIWLLLFLFNIIPYNPIFFLIFGYIITLFEILYLYNKKINKYNLIKFININIIIKFIPILILFSINKFYFNYNDIYFGFILSSFYLFLMIILNINPFDEYKKLLNSYINNDEKYKSIFSKFYDKLFNIFYHFIHISLTYE